MAKITKIGRMNERIEFYNTENRRDEWGEIKPIKTQKHSCWATIRSQFLRESQANIGTILQDTITFIIRYNQSVSLKSEWKITWRNQDYEIIQINPDHNFKEFTTIIAKRIS